MTKVRLVLLLLFLSAGAGPAGAQIGSPVRLVQTIPLPGVEGRIDHLAMDVKRGRLFVAALGNDTVEVVDLKAGKRFTSLTALREPQGIALDTGAGRVFVACGQSGDCHLFDAGTLRPLRSVPLGDDADNVRRDTITGSVYVGYSDGAIAVLDAGSGRVKARIPLAGHPESFQMETGGPRLFVNVPSRGQIAVVDRRAGRVIAAWPVPGASANFPMALDEADHRLFIGCRSPATLLILDTETGKPVARTQISGDTDDLFWDAKRKRIYVSCGAGYLDIVRQGSPDQYERIAHLPTAAGARTALFVPELARLYLAVPHRGGQGAEIRVYATE